MNDLKVMYFDEEDQVLKLVEGQENRKTKSGLLTVYAPYGDRFVLVSYKAWLEKWTGYVPSVPKPNVDGNLKRDFLNLMDDSLFMRSFDKKDRVSRLNGLLIGYLRMIELQLLTIVKS